MGSCRRRPRPGVHRLHIRGHGRRRTRSRLVRAGPRPPPDPRRPRRRGPAARPPGRRTHRSGPL
ncbi:hypothetical protein MMA15_03520 [Streptomyces sp. M600PL45_2]|uniref:Uncharacterized protein n=1 Tax=Streptomyces marispadix TaxID=2922868 RepID=A0ABS9STD8_9ACTN|nr:hypothetical protein [Streptomyces marispadix]